MSDDLTQKLPSSQDGMLAQILTTVQNLSTQMESLEQRFTGLEQKVERLEQKVVGLEQKVEERLYDTRPIWEKVQADVTALQEGQRSLQANVARLQEGQDALRKDVREANTHWRDMNRRLSLFNDTLAEMQTDYRDIYDRVRGLEKQSS
jgi:chromosome segregation ATPase